MNSGREKKKLFLQAEQRYKQPVAFTTKYKMVAL